MGLTTYAKGLDQIYDCGYITFGVFRMNLAKAYNQEFGEIYEKWYRGNELSEEEIQRWNDLCDDNLDIFLLHSDGDGKFTPKECRLIYNSIKDLEMDMMGHNYGDVSYADLKRGIQLKQYNMLERWKYIFKYCYKRRINLYFR